MREGPANIRQGWNVFFHFTRMCRTCRAVSDAPDNALQNRSQPEHIKSQIEINIFNTVTSASPNTEGMNAITAWMLVCIFFVFGALGMHYTIALKCTMILEIHTSTYSLS